MSAIIRRLVVLVLLSLFGCSSGGGGGSSTGPSTSLQPSGGGSTIVAPPQTGAVNLRFTLLPRAVPTEITQFRLSAFNVAGSLVKGPETFAKAAVIRWPDLPLSATRLQIEYLVGARISGLASLPIALRAGGDIDVVDPDFQTVEASLTGIQVTAPSTALPRGTSTQLTATGFFSDGSSRDLSRSVTWTTQPEGVVEVNSSGLATALELGDTTVSAALGSIHGSVDLRVTAARLQQIQLSRSSFSLAKGTELQLQAVGVYSDGTSVPITSTVSWSSNPSAVASVAAGLVHASQVGSTQILARLDGVEAAAEVTVTAAVLQSLEFSPPSLSLAKGTALPVQITGRFSDGTTQVLDAAWVSLQPETAAVDSDGLVSGLQVGNAQVVATVDGVQATLEVRVTAAVLQSIDVTAGSNTLPKGTSLQLSATGRLSDGSTQPLTSSAAWRSTNPAAATVDADGLVHGEAVGTSTIEATFNGIKGGLQLSVSQAVLQQIRLSSSSLSLPAGRFQTLQATGVYSDASELPLTSDVTWTSENSAVATVFGGEVTGKTVGDTEIVARLGSVEARAGIHVTSAELTELRVDPTAFGLASGLTRTLKAEGVYSDNSVLDLTTQVNWVTLQPDIADVSNAPGSQGLVTGRQQGSARVVARFQGQEAGADVTVSAAVPTALVLGPLDVSVYPNQEVPLTATARLSDGTLVDVTSQANWQSLNTARATVSAAGRLRGVAVGAVGITGSYQGVTAQLDAMVGNRFGLAPAGDQYSISRSGRLVAVPTGNVAQQALFGLAIYDYETGQRTPISVTPAGQETTSGSSSEPDMCGEDLVAFRSYAPDLVAGDTNACSDIFVRDLAHGVTVRVSTAAGGEQANAASWGPKLSKTGRYVAFSSAATNLVAGDTNGVDDVFVKDLQTGAIERISLSSAGDQANASSQTAYPPFASYATYDDLDSYYNTPAVSEDGRFVAFHSLASNLVANDTNNRRDVFVRDRQSGTTQRVSVSNTGTQGAGNSMWPRMSADGTVVIFLSDSNLAPGEPSNGPDLYARDLVQNTTTLVSTNQAGTFPDRTSLGNPTLKVSISEDGRFVAFSSHATNLVAGSPSSPQPSINAYIKDRVTGRLNLINRRDDGTPVRDAQGILYSGISGDGHWAYFTPTLDASQYSSNLPPGSSGLLRIWNRLEAGL